MNKRTIKILYIDHSGNFGGAERSLFEMICAFPKDSVESHFISPKGNTLFYAEKLGIHTISSFGISQLDITKYSYYRGIRWVVLLRELFFLIPSFFAIYVAKKRWRNIDIIHLNDITHYPSLILCRIIFPNIPIVMHVRCVVCPDTQSGLTRYILKKIKQSNSTLVAIDETVSRSMPSNLKNFIIHNSFSISSPISNIEKSSYTINKTCFTIGYVGTFIKVKGIYELIEAAKICKNNGLINVRFSLIGYKDQKLGIIKKVSKLFGLTQENNDEILELIQRYQLSDILMYEQFTSNLSLFYENIDVLCFPSHLNAVGRPVYEAAFFSKPSIVAIRDPLPDTIIDGKTGICIEEKNPQAIANAIMFFYNNPQELLKMGQQAKELANKNFLSSENAKTLLTLYQGLISNYKKDT